MQREYLLEGELKSDENPLAAVRTSIVGTDPWPSAARKIVSVVDNRSPANSIIAQYLNDSRRFRLGCWHRPEMPSMRELACSRVAAVLISSRLSGDLGLKTISHLRILRANLIIVALLGKPDIASFSRCFQAGADGIYSVLGTCEDLENTLALAIDGWKPFPREIGKMFADHVATRFTSIDGSVLTRAEAEVMEGLIRGKRDKEIAADRATSEGTIHAIMATLFRKFQVNSRRELVKRFLPLADHPWESRG